MAKLSFLAGFGAGYVLGAKAGQERYEQIKKAWENAKDNPQFQGVAGMAQARADGVVNSVKARMGIDTSSSGGGSSSAGSVSVKPASGGAPPPMAG
ncbi:hypothetical protein [Geodermatophilus sabuli]|uniref:hypothetical protein n=1 Tax=Geodermatophilus sabuli TaxID=1564158 RepID=UPI001EF78EAF|nr:hypothetical protein [Geodermatophilus sabuli]